MHASSLVNRAQQSVAMYTANTVSYTNDNIR